MESEASSSATPKRVVITEEFLQNYKDVNDLPPMYKRPTQQRVFVNRDLRLDSINYVGFDMDYTLAVYKSPAYEELSYEVALQKLIEMGYPEGIRSLKYDETFATRGLFLDTVLGNLLKVDAFLYITLVVHGREKLSPSDAKKVYPSMQIPHYEVGQRFYPMNTLFNVVDACLYADLVTYLEGMVLSLGGRVDGGNLGDEVIGNGKSDDVGIHSKEIEISYTNLFNDVRYAIDFVHQQGKLKERTCQDFDKYVERNGDRLALLLIRLRQHNKKSFLLTNSGYAYTSRLMTFLLEGQHPDYQDWKEYFDYIVVGADKPRFFSEGSTMREVNLETGTLQVKSIKKLQKGHVYNGGSLKQFQTLTGAFGSEILYVGDHIFSDIIVSKKTNQWRNLLVVRELDHEISVWSKIHDKYNHLKNLEYLFAEVYRGLDSECDKPPDVEILRNHIRAAADEVHSAFNPYFGSLFKSRNKPSFFAMQVQRYADLYTSSFDNLLNYPFFYYFSSSVIDLPHENQAQSNTPFTPFPNLPTCDCV